MKKLFSILTLAVVMASCSKDKEEVKAQPTIVGFWKGTYSNTYPFAALFRPDGTIRIYADNADTVKANKADGIYLLTPDKTGFDAKYSYTGNQQTYTLSGNMLENITKLKGAWAKDYSATSGSFELLKQ